MSKWDFDDVRTWKNCPYRYDRTAFSFLVPRTYAEHCKHRWESDLEARRYAEEMIRGEMPIDGVSMEHLFQGLAGALRLPEDRISFYGWANAFDWDLEAKEKSLIYQIVDDLLFLTRGVSHGLSPGPTRAVLEGESVAAVTWEKSHNGRLLNEAAV